MELSSTEFSVCSKPPNRDNHRKASYPRTQKRDQGADWTQTTQSEQSQKRRLCLLVGHAADESWQGSSSRHYICRAAERVGNGGKMTPGPMGFRGPMRGPMGFRKVVGFSGPIDDTEKSTCEVWTPFFLFWDHLISTAKTVRISVKNFFFLRSHHFSDQTIAFSPSILDFTNRKFVILELAPGPLLVTGGTVYLDNTTLSEEMLKR